MTRILFLDDCPMRAKAFLSHYPHAVVVTSAKACCEQLWHGQWDECHLDHDLGETNEDPRKPNTGSGVVRWIVMAKPDVRQFIVHSYNAPAAQAMVADLERAGYYVVRAPFPWKV